MSAEERRGPLRIPTEKIVAYLLNLDHRKGGLKARFFLSFGFTREEPGVMAETLIGQFFLGRSTTLPETEDARACDRGGRDRVARRPQPTRPRRLAARGGRVCDANYDCRLTTIGMAGST